MIFVYTFAVGGGSGTVRPFPNWALVCVFSQLKLPEMIKVLHRTRQATPITVSA